MSTLYIRDGENYREAEGHEVLDRAQAVIATRYRTGTPCLDSPARTAEFLRIKLGGLEYEVFAMLALDNRHRLIEYVVQDFPVGDRLISQVGDHPDGVTGGAVGDDS